LKTGNTNKTAGFRILLVDDESTVCEAVQMMLEFFGHEVRTAADGRTAMALFEASPFDLVITDYLMPDMKGDELVTRIKQHRPEQHIIMATAFADDFLDNGIPNRGLDHVLNKPFSLEDLRGAIAKVMA